MSKIDEILSQASPELRAQLEAAALQGVNNFIDQRKQEVRLAKQADLHRALSKRLKQVPRGINGIHQRQEIMQEFRQRGLEDVSPDELPELQGLIQQIENAEVEGE